MTTLPVIPLNDDWLCDYFELGPTAYEFLNGTAVRRLSEWTFDKRRVEGWAAWLQRGFVIEPVDECVRYLLYIDSGPDSQTAPARIYLNGRHVADFIPPGDDAPPFELDVTDNIYLEDNTIALRVECDAVGQFSGLRLQAVPCEST
jgi:hypothetical protein